MSVDSESNDVFTQDGVKRKSWRKLIWIGLGVGVFVLLIFAVGLHFYINNQVNKFFNLREDEWYMGYKCIEYCPYHEVYSQKMDSPHGNITSYTFNISNTECLDSCNYLNVIPINKERRNLGKFVSYFYNNGIKDKSDSHVYRGGLPDGECFAESIGGNKSCIYSDLIKIKRLDDAFIAPSWDNIILNFSSLACSPEGLDIQVDVVEGEIIGMDFLINDDMGNSFDEIKKMGHFNGLNSIKIAKGELSRYINNTESVGVSYIVEDKDYPEGRVSSSHSRRYCNSFINFN